jgi:hypothetical protein
MVDPQDLDPLPSQCQGDADASGCPFDEQIAQHPADELLP